MAKSVAAKPQPSKEANQTQAADPEPHVVAEATAAPGPPHRFVPASESRFATSAEFHFPLTSYVPEAGAQLGDVLKPEYWANIKALKAGCRIWVYAEDESFWAELLVRKVGQGFAKVQLLRAGELDQPTADPAVAAEYAIEFRGPLVKHRIVRLKDSQVLKDGIETYEDAAAWLRDHRRMLAA